MGYKSFLSKVTNPSECQWERFSPTTTILLPKKKVSIFSELVPPFYPPRLIDILLNGTFTTYSVHLLQQSTYRFNQESSPSKAIYKIPKLRKLSQSLLFSVYMFTLVLRIIFSQKMRKCNSRQTTKYLNDHL